MIVVVGLLTFVDVFVIVFNFILIVLLFTFVDYFVLALRFSFQSTFSHRIIVLAPPKEEGKQGNEWNRTIQNVKDYVANSVVTAFLRLVVVAIHALGVTRVLNISYILICTNAGIFFTAI